MENKNNPYLARIYFYAGHALFLGTMAKSKLHSHHAIEIVIGNKKPVNLITENTNYEDYVLLIRSDIPHTVINAEKEMILIILDPDTDLAQKLAAEYLANTDVASLNIKRDISVIDCYFSDPCIENAIGIYNSVIASLGITEKVNVDKDERIVMAVDYIRNLEVKKCSTKEIADHVGLSEGRLTHLFKEQLGIPVRKYLLWLRIIDAMNVMIEGKSPTYAAHETEFADYAHLSRSFSTMFGYSVSTFFNFIKFVKIETAL
ncbi:MAG: AraC family transcriptional regulator [Desulfobacteraceae bacterium]|jgi:AraC-like DNA-binding protein